MNGTGSDQGELPALIEVRGMTKVYGTGRAAVHALQRIDFRIERGAFVAVMGPSGSGKSTCMNILGCLDTPSSGAYLFEGVDVGGLSRDQRALLRRCYFGFVFQGFNLLNRTTALENVELPYDEFDYTVWLHGPEHIERRKLKPTLKALERLTRRTVLCTMPWGQFEHGVAHGNPYTRHLSHWYPEEWQKMRFYFCENRAHVRDGAVAQEWH